MKQRSVTHSTFVIERHYPATPARVFAAFSDPARKQRWFAEGEHSAVGKFEMDFRAGGKEVRSFRSKDGLVFTNETIYRDIVPEQRIVFSYTMSLGERCFSSSQSTVEMLANGKGTDLFFIEQAAFFEGADGPKMREEGWRLLLDQLARALD